MIVVPFHSDPRALVFVELLSFLALAVGPGWEVAGALEGVMGIQHVKDVTLIRHAYVRAAAQGRGIGSELLEFLSQAATGPLLVGTWAAAVWAIRFYERHTFRLTSTEEKDRLLTTYWNIPRRQRDTSVVLVRGKS